ncbi:MAG: putative sporulation protein YtxC [Peptococcaceae bacterium]|nr:putative sporulation protein YtxC [Peptococcaceae bacterium]
MSEQEYRVFTRQYADELSRRVRRLCTEEELPLNYSEDLQGETLAMTFTLPDMLNATRKENILCRIQKYYFIQALIDVVQDCWEQPQVYARLKKIFEWSDEDIGTNGNSIMNKLNSGERGSKDLRGKFLARELIAYFEEQNDLDIEGYLDFRGKTYHNVLARQVDSAVAELQMEEEEKSSLELMRNILQRRPEKFTVLHMKLLSSDDVSLWSSRGRPLGISEEGEPCESDVSRLGEPIEDVLVPILYLYGPREIVLHACHMLPQTSKEILAVLGVLQSVFGEDFRICPGCGDCFLA